MPDGEMIQLGGKELDTPGYDLMGAFVGSEGTLGHRHQGVAARRAGAGDDEDAGRLLRLHQRRRQGRLRDRRRRRRAGRDRDDGQARDRGLRADGPRRLSGRPRRGAADRARRRRARVRGALRRGRADLRAVRLRRHPHRQGRGRAPAVLEDAQGRLPRDGPDRPQLLRAGRRDPAHQAARGAPAPRRAVGGVRDAGRQRLPRRRRQPAPARLLRRPQGGRGREAPRSCRA